MRNQMHKAWSKIVIQYLVLGIGLLGLNSVYADSQGVRQGKNAELAKIKAATNQYKDVAVALEAGYISSVDMGAGCVDAETEGVPKQLGAMGIHFVKLEGFGLSNINFRDPRVLVYSPDPTVEHCTYSTGELMEDASCRDSLKLVAVEELIFAHLIEAENGEHWNNVPEFMGQQFYFLQDNPMTTWVDEAHGFPPHYELHIWLYDNNPMGLTFPWNPNLSCPAHLKGHH
jgi:hypothetical protein